MKKLMLFLMVAALVAGCSAPMDEASQNDLMLKKASLSAVINVPGDYTTIQAAIDATSTTDGAVIMVANGNFYGALITKAVTIKGSGKTVINDGPVHGSGMIQGFRLMDGSTGTILSNLTFEVDLAILNGAAVSNVTVTQCTFNNSVQAISNWRGNGWEITHNVITDLRTNNGGGIGILVGDYTGGVVGNNLVSFNKISGELNVFASDGGGYNGTGIVFYADFRDGATGASAIKNNRVLHNSVSLVSNNPVVVNVVAFELTDSRDDGTLEPVIFDNNIGFNDFRGTTIQVALTPTNLGLSNVISKNLGDNRGHGVHPSLFK